MGFHPVSKVEIVREYDPRRLVVFAWDDETGATERKEFGFDDLASALEWARQKLDSRSM